MKRVCDHCKKNKEHHAKGLCYSCYRKLNWSPKEGICKRCKRKKLIHARGFCSSCYNFVYHKDKSKAYYQRKSNNIDLKTYKKATKSCVLCGFTPIVDIFHLDLNKENNQPENLVGLCPNHHRMAKSIRYSNEIYEEFLKKGIIRSVPFKN